MPLPCTLCRFPIQAAAMYSRLRSGLVQPYVGEFHMRLSWAPPGSERDYWFKLDDPSFPAPIYATLIEAEGQEGLQLIWSRPNRDRASSSQASPETARPFLLYRA